MEPCRLLQLPDEVKLEIVRHVHRRRDLYNFSLACRSLEDMTLSRLYKSIDLDLPHVDTPNWNQDGLPTFRPFVLQNMRELAIRNGVSDVKNPVYHKRRRSDANSMEGYVGEIFRGVPRNRLKAFSFLHQTPMSLHMLDGLTKQHSGSLRHLQCCELEMLNKSDISLPSNLRSLECRSVLSGEAVAKLIANNKTTLRSLSLGQDKYLIQQYRQRRIGFLNNVPQPFEPFHTTLDLTSLPSLRSLSLSGLDLAALIPQAIEAAANLVKLESLTLESCPNTAPFLDILASIFTHLQNIAPDTKIQLKKLSVRHEFFTTQLKDSLVRFLGTFSGLESLTILVENTTFNTRPSTFLTTHSQTLKTLVLESRVQPREHVHIDTSRPFGATGTSEDQLWQENITDITSLCPNLVELGIAYPWDNDRLQTHISKLGTLTSLKTLHIRNSPSSQTHTELGDVTIKAYAESFLSHLSSQSLDYLAIGPTLYASRWRLGSVTNTQRRQATQQPQAHPIPTAPAPRTLLHTSSTATPGKKPNTPPEHLRTHHFRVARDGTVAAVGERYMEEIRGRGLGGVFEGVWLR